MMTRRMTGAGRLAALIHQPGGMTEGEATRAAAARLAELGEAAARRLDTMVDALLAAGEAALAAPMPAARDRSLADCYDRANAVVGVAAPLGCEGLGQVAFCLCELIDLLRSAERWNPDALRVHLDGVRLMHATRAGGHEASEMARALRRLHTRLGELS